MTRRTETRDETKLQGELARKQRNTVWPDPMVNGSSVDEFLWKGSPRATPVQRAGAAILGLFFAISGVGFLSFEALDHSILELLFAMLWVLLGWKIFANAFRSA